MRNPGCTHAALSQLKYTAQEACLKIGLDMCATGHYLNMYETYYCRLQQSKALYIFFEVAAFAYLLVTLNYIRRTYYIQHIQKLRRILKLPDFVAESILLPVSYGVVPIFIRILASINRLAFSFHTGANIAKQIAEIDITRDKVEGRVKLDNPNSVVKTIEVIVYSLRSASPILSSEAIK